MGDGMKVLQGLLGADKDKADRFMRLGLNIKSFHNVNQADINVINQDFGKPLDTVTDQEIQDYFASKLNADMIAAAQKFLKGIGRMDSEVGSIKDEFPVNDLEA